MPAVRGFPKDETEARECVHGNTVWFGNECGLCEHEGYRWAEPKTMPFDEALDYAIFAINTYLYPDASSADDTDNLEMRAEDVIATLADIREAVTKA